MPQVEVIRLWLIVAAPVGLLILLLSLVAKRRLELHRFERIYRERIVARNRGSDKARLQYPEIDLSKCVGCGACIAACPEDGVLDLLHGQAVVVHGARCVGHGRCADACPTGGITVTLGDISNRRDLPATDDQLAAVGVPGLYLAGEVTGFALVRTAVQHGVAVANSVAAERGKARGQLPPPGDGAVDLLIVGSGPAGMSCALRAKEIGLRAQVVEQAEHLGGTVAAYPRRKMVMTQPLHLPLHGKLPKLEYQKETLIELWEKLAREHHLDISTGEQVTAIRSNNGDGFEVETTAGLRRARSVCLALGRRGTPRKLGVPGEDLAKVLYSLVDAGSYNNSRILVVGGGDSAVEAALGLSLQPGNQVTLSYRGGDMTKIKAKNEQRLHQAVAAGRVSLVLDSQVTSIAADTATLSLRAGEERTIPNDFVFVLIGGIPPFQMLEAAGVSFDPADMHREEAVKGQSSSLATALGLLLACAVGIGLWVLLHAGYYTSPVVLRPGLAEHGILRPSGPVGLPTGALAVALFIWNLLYLVRRARRGSGLLPGSLRFWMSTHILSGMLAFFCVFVHSCFTARPTAGGFAFLALGIVIASGIMGRYLYAFVPRAANGKELDLEHVGSRMTMLSSEWDRHGGEFGARVRSKIEALTDGTRWKAGLFARIYQIIRGQILLRHTLHTVRVAARREGVSEDARLEIELLARSAYRTSLQIANYEEIRAVLSSWRFIHRWLALLMILLAVVHIVIAVQYADFRWLTARGDAS